MAGCRIERKFVHFCERNAPVMILPKMTQLLKLVLTFNFWIVDSISLCASISFYLEIFNFSLKSPTQKKSYSATEADKGVLN